MSFYTLHCIFITLLKYLYGTFTIQVMQVVSFWRDAPRSIYLVTLAEFHSHLGKDNFSTDSLWIFGAVLSTNFEPAHFTSRENYIRGKIIGFS